MTPGEQKIYDALMELRTDMATYEANQKTLTKAVEGHDGHIETMKADRNKFIGIAMVGGTMGGLGFFGWIGSLVMEYFKSKH